MGVEVGSTVAEGVGVSMLVGEGGMGVAVTETSNGSGKGVSVDNNPGSAWLQELKKMPSAAISVKTRLFHFSKANYLQAIFLITLFLTSTATPRKEAGASHSVL